MGETFAAAYAVPEIPRLRAAPIMPRRVKFEHFL
jgi:hypothetical protein